MSEDEYRDLVLKEYERLAKSGTLPFNLISPTRKSLKDECVKACSERYESKDEPLLSTFFGSKENAEAYVKAIQHTSAEEFKTLHNFLNNHRIKTSFDNIRLLAWLIDFKPRPYHMNLPPVQLKNMPQPQGLHDRDKAPEVAVSPAKPYKKALIAAIVIVSLSIGYIVYKMPPGLNGDEDCMVWANDHFQPVYCKGLSGTTLKWPVNYKLVEEFKKITEPDTLTNYSVRKVYYANFKGRHEFFTTDGPFPLDTNRRLLPMTTHIFEKYVLHIKN